MLSIICEIILLIKFPAIAYFIPVLGTVCTVSLRGKKILYSSAVGIIGLSITIDEKFVTISKQ